MGSRNLLGGPEGKAGFQNRETWTLLLWFLGRTDGMQRHWLKQKGWQRVWLLGQTMTAWGPGEEPLGLDREVMSYKRPRTCRNKVGTEDSGQREGAWEGRGRPMAMASKWGQWNLPQTGGLRVVLYLHKPQSLPQNGVCNSTYFQVLWRWHKYNVGKVLGQE